MNHNILLGELSSNLQASAQLICLFCVHVLHVVELFDLGLLSTILVVSLDGRAMGPKRSWNCVQFPDQEDHEGALFLKNMYTFPF